VIFLLFVALLLLGAGGTSYSFNSLNVECKVGGSKTSFIGWFTPMPGDG